ncbi:MAG: hypothetical protein NTY33_02050 [Candidatus Moranbacteria bacterium]|nr:hypothetical protein [Candidatus Moranbacteria bacterium]
MAILVKKEDNEMAIKTLDVFDALTKLNRGMLDMKKDNERLGEELEDVCGLLSQKIAELRILRERFESADRKLNAHFIQLSIPPSGYHHY